jgi:hypothetical protein
MNDLLGMTGALWGVRAVFWFFLGSRIILHWLGANGESFVYFVVALFPLMLLAESTTRVLRAYEKRIRELERRLTGQEGATTGVIDVEDRIQELERRLIGQGERTSPQPPAQF